MWIHNLDPVIVQIGPLAIRYYGLAYLIGALLCYWVLNRASKRGDISLTKEEVSDFVGWIVLGVLIGSRVFYILFYNLSFYIANPLKIFAVWEGGMAFHGGFVGIVLACYLYCRKKNISFFKIADILAVPVLFALALGRIANFINGELFGTPTNLPWCVVVPPESVCRHPYQLYDGLKRFVIVGWLVYLGREKRQDGFIFWNLVFFEGLGRFVLDFLKDEFTVFFLTPGQWMSIAMVVVASYYLFVKCVVVKTTT